MASQPPPRFSRASESVSPQRRGVYPVVVASTNLDPSPSADEDDHSYTESEKEQFRRLWESGHVERLMRMWGETAAGMRWMHDRSSEIWIRLDERLNVWNVALSSVISAGSFMGSGTHAIPQSYVMTATGVLGLAHILINSLSKYYNAAHHVAMHQTASRQFGNLHRTIVAKLSLSRAERGDPRAIFAYLAKENERLYNETPEPHLDAVCAFRATFLSSGCDVQYAVPDIVNTCFRISVEKRSTTDGAVTDPTLTPAVVKVRDRAFSLDV